MMARAKRRSGAIASQHAGLTFCAPHVDGFQEVCDNAGMDGAGPGIGGYDGADGNTWRSTLPRRGACCSRDDAGGETLGRSRLFDFACRIALDGIRNQFPDVDEQRMRQILAERVELGRRLENTR